jgi:ABC-2 type transport system permease protein
MNARRLRAIAIKEFTQMRRDKATLRLMLFIPVMQLLIFGYAIRMDVRNLPLAVYDASRTQESRELAQQFEATRNFRMVRQATSYEDALHLIDSGVARSALVIPPDYARAVKRSGGARVQVLVDATSPTASQGAIAAAQLVGQRASVQILAHRAGGLVRPDALPVDVRVRPLYNPALSSPLFIVPGIIGMILFNVLIIVTALSIVREREFGTLEQLIVTPLTRTEIMLGKLSPYMIVGFVQITTVLLVGHFLFRVPIHGSLLLIYATSFLFVLSSLGLGLLVSTLVSSQAPAMQTAVMIIMPNVLLSGFMFPREAMPPFANWLGLLLPLTYYLEILRGIILKGVGVRELWVQILALIVFAFTFFTIATLRFHKKLD